MEPEPSLGTLLKAITALTATVGSLQDQIRAQGQQLSELKETANLLGNKDQGGAQTQPGPLTGPITPPTQSGGETHTPGMVRPGLKAPFHPSRGTGFDSEEEEEPRQALKKEPCNTPKRSLSSLTPFDSGSSVKRPKMELPNPYKGDSRGRKATQWLDCMLLWVAVVDTINAREFIPIFSNLNKSWDLGPFLPSTPTVKIGEVSLERITCLLLGLLGQVEQLKQEVAEIKEAGVKTCTNVKNISQTVDVVKDGLRSLQSHRPRTPEDTKPPVVEAMPRPLSKVDPIGSTSWVSFWDKPSKGPQIFAQPTPVQAVPLQVPSPIASPRLQSPIGAPAPPPPAPATHYPTPVKVDHPHAHTGKIGSKAKQWLTCMLAWTRLNLRMFPTNQEVLSFLLMNMKDSAGAWAHPHLDQLGSHQAIIQTVEGFKLEFLAAFGNPDATRAAKRKITTLTQSSTCADYITKFRTLAMELDWNNAALRGQFAQGLHWENAALVIDNALRKECASHPPKDNKSSRPSNPTRGTSTGQATSGSKKLSNNPNFVSEEERNCCRAAGACIKCGKMGHKFAECRTGWKATPIEDKGKAKETAKIGKESGPKSGKD
ncbi:Retrotransposon-derived protein PEG10 [Rhizoctonia solani]|uniref:Retrotransposon-derived protein PEG10 n=1 Tax=Rhizoctonia solani TaxID=456999 RepID=A0A8H8NXH3_9AGAM|nr:Retrotransposon-derived protein PEG10 [Rhizoctonia solani]QRW20557.1 Retrotransposon-derived protein PEG10 [Rhizoctonia solani]